jgi:hypothetical protein
MADTTTELQELAAIFDEADSGPGSDPAPEAEAEAKTDADADADAPPPKEETKAEEKPKVETESKAWKRIRLRTKEQDAKEQQLARAEAALKANEAALQTKAGEAARILALHERAKGGDPAALQELGYDLEALNSSYLKHQTGDARLEQMERRQREQEKREEEAASRKEKERQEREEQERAEAAMNTVFEEAKKMPLLGKKSRDRVVALCEYVAQEWVSGGPPLHLPGAGPGDGEAAGQGHRGRRRRPRLRPAHRQGDQAGHAPCHPSPPGRARGQPKTPGHQGGGAAGHRSPV